jgi:hypothetical protein
MTIHHPARIPHQTEFAYAEDAPLDRLCTAELLLVTSLRLFAAAHCEPDAGHDWRGGLAAAAPAFEALFGIVAITAWRPLDVRCRHCQHLGQDEARLLQIVGLLQHGRMFAARDVLAVWLPPAAARLAILPAKALAAALACDKLFVPSVGTAQPTHRGSRLVH